MTDGSPSFYTPAKQLFCSSIGACQEQNIVGRLIRRPCQMPSRNLSGGLVEEEPQQHSSFESERIKFRQQQHLCPNPTHKKNPNLLPSSFTQHKQHPNTDSKTNTTSIKRPKTSRHRQTTTDGSQTFKIWQRQQ